MAVPEGSGLGVELNEEVARQYAKPGEPFFEDEAGQANASSFNGSKD